MNLRRPLPPLKIPPRDYRIEDFQQVVRFVNELLNNINNPGDIVGSSLQFINLAENGYNLPTGGVYVDANGFLKMVRENEVFAPSFDARAKLGTVTVNS